MQHLRELKATNLQGLSPRAVAELAQQMLAHIQQQSQQIEHQAHELKFNDAKLQKVLFELARLKAWKFGAKTEAMNAEQRRLFEETMAEDEAALQAQLEQLQKQLQAKQPKPADEKDKEPASRIVSIFPNTCGAKTTSTTRRTPIARRPIAAAPWCA